MYRYVRSATYPLQVWGIVYLCSGLTTTFVQIDKRSHTFFLSERLPQGSEQRPNASIMKKLMFLLAAAALFAACSSTKEVDDEPTEPSASEAAERLETLCEQLNGDLATLRALIAADELPDCVVSVAPIAPDGETVGYGFAFKQNGPITFYLGTNAPTGNRVPQFGVYEADGIRCWAMNGQQLPTATGEPVPVVNEEGIAPRLKTEKGYWYISVDDGANWWPAGPAPDGTTELATASLVAQVTEETDAWGFVLADGETTLSVPKEGTLNIAVVADEELKFQPNEIHTVHYTVTGGGSKTVVTAELENPDGSYNIKVTPTDLFSGSVSITAAVPTINKVIVAVTDGSRTASTTVDLTLRPVLTEKMVTVITPGTLADLLADYDQVAITELTIVGYLNEEDFRTLNTLPNLAVLDLENVNLEILPEQAFARRDLIDPNLILTSVKLPKNLVEIGEYAFYNCQKLIDIIIPQGVTTIGNSAFQYCLDLTEIVLPENVTEIGFSAFRRCGLTEISLPENIAIKGYTFQDCMALTKVTMPKNATEIGNGTFYGCTALTDITLPEGITEISAYLFYQCSSLTNINIPNSVTLIWNHAFYGCKLTSITIPANVTRISLQAFSVLSEVYCKAQVPPSIYQGTFSNQMTLYVPVGTAEAYKAAEGWKDFWHIIEMEF